MSEEKINTRDQFIEPSQVPLLRVHVISARGLPRSMGAVGMPDSFVVVKFNGEKVGKTKVESQTRQPDWNDHFDIRADPGSYPDSPMVRGTNWARDGAKGLGVEGRPWGASSLSLNGRDCIEEGQKGCNSSSCCYCFSCNNGCHDSCYTDSSQRGLGQAVENLGNELTLEVWDHHEDGEEKPRKGRQKGDEKPNNIFDDRLFDLSFVSKRLGKRAMRGVTTAVTGRSRVIGVCNIGTPMLRALGASAEPMDLKLRDPKGGWWGKGTIRVGVSLERLRAVVIGAQLEVDTPLLAGINGVQGSQEEDVASGALAGSVGVEGGRERGAAAGGEDKGRTELTCKVTWNGRDLAAETPWDKGFCITRANNLLVLDSSALPVSLSPTAGLSSCDVVSQLGLDTVGAGGEGRLEGIHREAEEPLEVGERVPGSAGGEAVPQEGACVEDEAGVKEGAEAEMDVGFVIVEGGEKGELPTTVDEEKAYVPAGGLPSSPKAAASPLSGSPVSLPPSSGVIQEEEFIPTLTQDAPGTTVEGKDLQCIPGRPFPSPPSDPSSGYSVGYSSDSGGNDDMSTGPRFCSLRVGCAYFLSTFNAQGLADLLNSNEAWTEGAAGTKEWHEKGFRLTWDWGRGRFVILNVLKVSFVLKGGESPMATDLLGFSFRDHYSCPAPEAFLDPHQPSDPPRKHLAVIADLPPPPLLRPQWQRVVWGPPAMEVARGGKLEIQVWARETGSEDRAWGLRRWRRGSARAGVGGGLEQVDSSDGSWLVGFASLDGTDVCRLVTGRAVELPLRKPSPPKRGTSPETSRGKKTRRVSGLGLALGLGLGLGSGPAQGMVENLRAVGSTAVQVGQVLPSARWWGWKWGLGWLGWWMLRWSSGQPVGRHCCSCVKRGQTVKGLNRARVKVVRRSVPVGCGGASVSAGFVVCGRVRGCWCGHCCCCGGGGLVRALTTRMGKETTSDGRGYQLNRKGTGTGEGAQVHRDLSVDFGSDEALGRSCEGGRGGKGGGSGSVRQEKIVGEGAGRVAEKSKGPGGMSRWFRVLGREEGEVFSARTARCSSLDILTQKKGLLAQGGRGGREETSGSLVDLDEVRREQQVLWIAQAEGAGGEGVEIVGSVKVSLGLRDKSMVLMRVLRQWNMGRDEASVLQRRAAQEEARRLWMLLPGISLWRVLVQVMGMSLLVSYCVTLALRAYHSNSCKASYSCNFATDPKLATLREWQILIDNLLTGVAALDMVLQFRTAFVDKNSKIIVNPKKVATHYLGTWFVPDLLCSLPYRTLQPLFEPILASIGEEVDSGLDSLMDTCSPQVEAQMGEAGSPLSLWVFKLSKALHVGKINSIRGTRAFKYLDDLAMGIDFTVKQAIDVVQGKREVLRWLGKPPKRRKGIGKFLFRIGIVNKWTHIVLSYKLLGYAKFLGTLVRAMRLIAVTLLAVPRAANIIRLAAVFLRSYFGRQRSKDLHEASVVIQRRIRRHMARKVAGRVRTHLLRKARTKSEPTLTNLRSDHIPVWKSTCPPAQAPQSPTPASALGNSVSPCKGNVDGVQLSHDHECTTTALVTESAEGAFDDDCRIEGFTKTMRDDDWRDDDRRDDDRRDDDWRYDDWRESRCDDGHGCEDEDLCSLQQETPCSSPTWSGLSRQSGEEFDSNENVERGTATVAATVVSGGELC